MMTRQEFLAWEQASRDTIDVKRCYIDLAGEDLVAGILLSQIVYWHLPGRDGGDKLVIEKGGERWLAKGRGDWWDECRISPKQFDRASALLERLGLIETGVRRFRGSPTKHIRLCWDVFLRELALLALKAARGNPAEGKMEIPQRSISKSPKGEGQNSPSGKIQLDLSARFLTETETKNFKDSFREAGARAGAGEPGRDVRAKARAELATADTAFARDYRKKHGLPEPEGTGEPEGTPGE